MNEVQEMAAGILSGRITGLRNLKNIRKQKYSTQRAFIEAIGVDRQTYNSWETCRHWPKADTAILIAAALDCTVEDLLREPEDRK